MKIARWAGLLLALLLLPLPCKGETQFYLHTEGFGLTLTDEWLSTTPEAMESVRPLYCAQTVDKRWMLMITKNAGNDLSAEWLLLAASLYAGVRYDESVVLDGADFVLASESLDEGRCVLSVAQTTLRGNRYQFVFADRRPWDGPSQLPMQVLRSFRFLQGSCTQQQEVQKP